MTPWQHNEVPSKLTSFKNNTTLIRRKVRIYKYPGTFVSPKIENNLCNLGLNKHYTVNPGYQSEICTVCSPVCGGWGDQCAGRVLGSGHWGVSKQRLGIAAGGSRLKLIWGQFFFFFQTVMKEGRLQESESLMKSYKATKWGGVRLQTFSDTVCVRECVCVRACASDNEAIGC